MRLLNAIKIIHYHPGTCDGQTAVGSPGYQLITIRSLTPVLKTRLVIELNASRRLDIDWRWISYAMEKARCCLLILMHTIPMDMMTAGFGVLAAHHKGGLTKDGNLVVFIAEFEEYLKKGTGT